MIPVDQDEFYPGGNCWEAAAASILELPLEALREHGRLRTAWHAGGCKDLALIDGYYRERSRLRFHVVPQLYPPREDDGIRGNGWRPPGVIPRGYSIANGPGKRAKPDGSPIYHSCVALDGVVVHDPHPSRGGLVEIEHFEVLIPTASAGDAAAVAEYLEAVAAQ